VTTGGRDLGPSVRAYIVAIAANSSIARTQAVARGLHESAG
jgi:hypothetical protein